MKTAVFIAASSPLRREDHTIPMLICKRVSFVRASLLDVGTCLLLAMLARCSQPSTVSYEDLCGPPREQMAAMDEDDVLQWITEQDSTPGRLEEIRDGESIVEYAWTRNGIIWTAHLRGGQVFRISSQYDENGPTFGDVVASIGTPEMVGRTVTSYGGHVVYILGLDYLELGISVDGDDEMTARELSRSAKEWSVTLRENMEVDNVSCYSSHLSPEEVLGEVFLVPPEAISSEVRSRMPWPGFGASVPLGDLLQ
jgi:hypothetical protein